MKRTVHSRPILAQPIVALSAMALVLALGSAARADDTPSAQPASPAPTTTKTTSTTHHSSSHHKGSHPLDLNTATKEQLMMLPGVDDATADKIIGARPYTSVSQLEKKSVLTKEEYGKIKSKVMVKKQA